MKAVGQRYENRDRKEKNMASLSLKHVYKVYPNGNKAVSDFSMEIADKEFIVFVGPSGCGKSTTLRMIAGLEEITTGEVYIDGMLVNDMEPKDRDIAMVFQNYALYPHISVYENMAFGLKIRKIPNQEIHRRVLEAAEILGITDYLDKKPKEMSGGQRQRVALGRAIVREPKVFLLDEPLSNLDAKLRTQMRSEISKLHAKLKTTFIYVTHDQTEAMTMGTRIVVMRGGVIQQIDTPRNLYSEPQSKFVAGFIGTPQMNFFDVTLRREGETVLLSLSDAGITWTVPYSAFLKVKPAYLTGEKRVILGVRAERVVPLSEGEGVTDGIAAVCTVSHVEELGDEALVYGDLSSGHENELATRTGIVFKVGAERGMEIRAGEMIPLGFDLRYAHFFDGETEVSIRPPIPAVNVFDCSSDGTNLSFCGLSFSLPDALRTLPQGELTAEIPIEGIHSGKTGLVTVTAYEQIGETLLTHLMSGGRTFFAAGDLGEVGSRVGISIDFKTVTFFEKNKCVCEALSDKSPLYGAIMRDTVREVTPEGRRRKAVEYSFEIAGEKYRIPDDILEKLLKTAGMGVLKKKLRYEIPPHAVKVGEGKIAASVLRNLDYGDEHYTVLSVGGREVIARTDGAWEGNVQIDIALHDITYIDDGLDVILM